MKTIFSQSCESLRAISASVLALLLLGSVSLTEARTPASQVVVRRQSMPVNYYVPAAAAKPMSQPAPVMIPTAIAVPAPVMPMMQAYLHFDGRFAAAPNTLPVPVQYAVTAGNELQNKPYVRGGGHKALYDYGYDCSGSVSYTLAKAGLLNRPLSSKEFASYGEAGPGRFITIYVKPGEHVFMSICGLRFDTSGGSESQGPRWRPTPRNASGFIVRHPFGL